MSGRLFWILAGLWALVAALHARDGRSAVVIGYDVCAALLFAAFGAALCRRASQGRSAGKGMMAALLAAAVALVVLFGAVARMLPSG